MFADGFADVFHVLEGSLSSRRCQVKSRKVRLFPVNFALFSGRWSKMKTHLFLKQWKLQPRQETAVTLRSDLDLQRHSAFKICPRTKVNVLPLFHKYYYQLPPNMAFQLANEICCIKHCWDLNKQNTFLVDDWTAKLVTIPGNTQYLDLQVHFVLSSPEHIQFHKLEWVVRTQ